MIKRIQGQETISTGWVFEPDEMLPTLQEQVERGLSLTPAIPEAEVDSGWVFSSADIFPTLEEKAERALAFAPAIPEAEPEVGVIRLDNLDGWVIAGCILDMEWGDKEEYKLLGLPGGQFIISQSPNYVAPGSWEQYNYRPFATRLYLIPRDQGLALARLDDLIRDHLFDRYICNAANRRCWRTLSLSLTT